MQQFFGNIRLRPGEIPLAGGLQAPIGVGTSIGCLLMSVLSGLAPIDPPDHSIRSGSETP
jgi:hypothetical protein